MRRAEIGQRQLPELTVGLNPERVGIRLLLALALARRSKEIQQAFLQEWQIQAAAEPSDLGRDEAQRCSHSCLVVSIPDREARPQSLATFPHSPRVFRRPQKKL